MHRTSHIVMALGLALAGSTPLFAHGAPAIPHMLVEYPSPQGGPVARRTGAVPSPVVTPKGRMAAAVAGC